MEPIRSPRNRAVVEAGRLHRARERKRLGLTLLEGPNLLDEALEAGISLRRVFALPDDPRREDWPNVTLVEERVMRRLAPTETPRGPVAVTDIPDWSRPAGDRHLLVLWRVSDPGNVGTIIRSAAAFGLGVAVSPECADPWSPKALRAGAGGHFRLPSLSRIEGLHPLSHHRLAATVVSGGEDPARLDDGPWAFLIGQEAHGLEPEMIQEAEKTVTIPMPGGTESLNVAAAATILAYAVTTGSRGFASDH